MKTAIIFYKLLHVCACPSFASASTDNTPQQTDSKFAHNYACTHCQNSWLESEAHKNNLHSSLKPCERRADLVVNHHGISWYQVITEASSSSQGKMTKGSHVSPVPSCKPVAVKQLSVNNSPSCTQENKTTPQRSAQKTQLSA